MNVRLMAWRSATILWCAWIYAMSSSPKMTSEQTRSWLAVWIERMFGWNPPAEFIRNLGLLLRKGVHFGEYAILAWLVYQALEGIPLRRWVVALVFAGAYAVSDEVHQIFVPGRGASATDWIIDLAGASAAIYLLHRRGPNKEPLMSVSSQG